MVLTTIKPIDSVHLLSDIQGYHPIYRKFYKRTVMKQFKVKIMHLTKKGWKNSEIETVEANNKGQAHKKMRIKYGKQTKDRRVGQVYSA